MKAILTTVALIVNVVSFSQEHARILDFKTTYSIYENTVAEIDRYLKIEILSEQGYKYAMYSDYYDKYRKLTDVTVDVIDRNGNKVKRLRRNDGIEFGLSPSYEISDITELFIDPKYKQFPFVMEINYKIKLDGFISMPDWVPRSDFNLAVVKAELAVIRSKKVDVNFHEEHIKGVTNEEDKKIITKYKVENLPAVEKKLRFKDFYDQQPKVLVSPKRFRLDNAYGSAASWKDFGDWYLSLNSEPFKLSASTRNFIDGLDKSDKKNTIREIYQYMQDKTRYVSIQLGIGGYKSLPVEDVDKMGYGDCKALSTYTKAMLQHAGIVANYILVRAGDDVPDVIKEFPSNQFNHVYLGIGLPEDTVYLECTSQILPVDYTGKFTDDRNVLWIDNNRSSLIRSRVYDHVENVQNNFIKISIDDQGNALANFESINQGIFFDEIMIYKLAPGDFVKEYNQAKFGYGDFIIKKFTYDQPEREVPAFVSRMTVAVNSLAKPVGGRLVLPLIPARTFDRYFEYDDLQRFYSIKRGLTIVDVIDIDLPKNYWIYNLPEPEKIDSPFGSYSIEPSVSNGKLTLRRKMVFYKGEFNNDGYDRFKPFFQAIEKIERKKLVLNSKT